MSQPSSVAFGDTFSQREKGGRCLERLEKKSGFEQRAPFSLGEKGAGVSQPDEGGRRFDIRD